jgi:CPA2 family monovalent cation:H+ antiporter-2
LAEIGVVLLMFTIDWSFRLTTFENQENRVCRGFMQLILTAGTAMLIAMLYNLTWKGALFVGFLTALSSTALS